MRKGFTLIELLVVVGIMLTLMGVVFKLGNIEAESKGRYFTVYRMQRLENCLSGYYAAFGCYPPVALHGSRDIYRRCTSHGIQQEEREENIWNWKNTEKISSSDTAEQKAWLQVEAACRSQPVGCSFPFPKGTSEDPNEFIDMIKSKAEEKRDLAQSEDAVDRYGETTVKIWQAGFDDGGAHSGNVSRFADKKDKKDWRTVQLFKFGLMSFLLPRYIVMMNSDEKFFEFAQWTENNPVPCNPKNGRRNYGGLGWNGIWKTVGEYWEGEYKGDDSGSMKDSANRAFTELANIPSQAVCARWVPYLEGICTCNRGQRVFGVQLRLSDDSTFDGDASEIYSPFSSGSSDSYTQQYVLDGVTMRDGWGVDFFYYSPAPHQAYTLWSAGPNKRTFPPWFSRDKLPSQKAQKCVSLWIEDDIISLSN